MKHLPDNIPYMNAQFSGIKLRKINLAKVFERRTIDVN
jgi:hypothetical protein